MPDVCAYGVDVKPGAPGYVWITSSTLRDWLGSPWAWFYPALLFKQPEMVATADFCADTLLGGDMPTVLQCIAALADPETAQAVLAQITQAYKVSQFSTYCQ